MSDTTYLTDEPTRPPLSFHIAAWVALLWGAFGAADYTMTKLHNASWFAAMKVDPAMIAKVDAAPVWATAGWALGVWFTLLGAIALVLRKRQAGNLFLVSIVGAVVGFAWQMSAGIVSSPLLPAIIVGITAWLRWYASRAAAKGWLR